MKTKKIIEDISKAMIELMETDKGHWNSGLKDYISTGIPYNKFTGIRYVGLNTLILYLQSLKHGWKSQIHGTAKNWNDAGYKIKKGAKGTHIVFSKWVEKESKELTTNDGEPLIDSYWCMRNYVVFNAEQVDGYEIVKEKTETIPTPERMKNVEQYINNTKAKIIEGGNRAFYSPDLDIIKMPELSSYKGTDNSSALECYYSTRLHELAHWTGHKDRLNRTMGKRFGDNDYAYEELVAETSSAFLCGLLNISSEPRPDHARYLKSWIKGIKDNPKALYMAFTQASKVVKYLDGLQDKKEMVA